MRRILLVLRSIHKVEECGGGGGSPILAFPELVAEICDQICQFCYGKNQEARYLPVSLHATSQLPEQP
jgi:hypothetical protein